MPRPSLAEFETFAAIAHHRSFQKAADAMGISRSALSHMLIGLERNIGVRLLNRTTRSVSPTDAGARLLERIGPLVRDFNAALDTIADEKGAASGPLRINANKAAAQLLLAEVVPTFLIRHPEVELDLVSDGRIVDIVAEGFDAGVRLAESIPQDMIAVRVGGDVRFIAVASPAYLAKKSAPKTPLDLSQHECIRQRLPSGKRYKWEFNRHGEELTVDVPGSLTLDDNDLMVQAAADGLGIAFVPDSFAHGRLRSGELLEVLPAWCPAFPGLMLYYPRNHYVPSALRAFIDVLKSAIVATRISSSS